MNLTGIIKRAVLSEKAYKQMEKGIYAFLVDEQVTKGQIKKAVKNQFNVDVAKVNIARVAQKSKRAGRTRIQTLVGGGKKAIVQLKSGQSIPMLSPKADTKKIKKMSKEKEAQKINVEGKET